MTQNMLLYEMDILKIPGGGSWNPTSRSAPDETMYI